MAVTKGFKISEDFKEKLAMQIEAVGLQDNEWLEKAFQLMDSQLIKEHNPSFSKEISEIEFHSRKIYELFNHMIQQNEFLRQAAVDQLEKKLDEKDTIISNYLQKQSDSDKQVKLLEEDLKNIKQALEELEDEHKKMSTQNENIQDLIDSLKEKNQQYIEQLEDYQLTKEHSSTLEEALKNEQEKNDKVTKELKTQFEVNSELKRTYENTLEEIKDKHTVEISNMIADHTIEITSIQDKHENELQSLKDKHSIEIERKILQKEIEFQEREKSINKAHQEELSKQAEVNRSIYEKMDEKNNLINDLKEEIRLLKSKPNNDKK